MSANHMGFYGMTGTGKSHLMKELAKALARYKQKIIVYGPIGDDGWPADALRFRDPKDLDNALLDPANWGAYIFIDEAKRLYNTKGLKEVPYMLSDGRHKGFTVMIAAQRPYYIPPDDRGNLKRVYCFRLQTKYDRHNVGEDFGEIKADGVPLSEAINQLGKYEYFLLTNEAGGFPKALKGGGVK